MPARHIKGDLQGSLVQACAGCAQRTQHRTLVRPCLHRLPSACKSLSRRRNSRMRLTTSAALSLQSVASQLQVLSRVDATRLVDVHRLILRSGQTPGSRMSHLFPAGRRRRAGGSAGGRPAAVLFSVFDSGGLRLACALPPHAESLHMLELAHLPGGGAPGGETEQLGG